MLNTYDVLDSLNTSISSPQQMIEALRRLQAETINPILSVVYIYDLVEQCTLCSSHSIAAMLGYTNDEIYLKDSLGLATLIHPTDLQLVSEHFQRFTTLVEGEVIAVEYRMKRVDGSWGWLRSQETVLVQAVDGFPLQVLGVVRMIAHPSNISLKMHPTSSKALRRRSLTSKKLEFLTMRTTLEKREKSGRSSRSRCS